MVINDTISKQIETLYKRAILVNVQIKIEIHKNRKTNEAIRKLPNNQFPLYT